MGLSVGKMMRFGRELSNGKAVITQTINGKTVTNVIDKEGNILLARAKKIDWQWVGNKKVSTRTDFYHTKKFVNKRIRDRVYDQYGTLLGRREIVHSETADCEALNNAMQNGNFRKYVWGGNSCKRVTFVNGLRRYANCPGMNGLHFDEKGLPKYSLETFGMDKLI